MGNTQCPNCKATHLKIIRHEKNALILKCPRCYHVFKKVRTDG